MSKLSFSIRAIAGATTALAVLTFPGACQVTRQSGTLAGVWEGTANVPNGRLVMQLDIRRSEGGWSGFFRVPAESVEIPIEAVQASLDSVTVKVVPGRIFTGVLNRDSLPGTLELDGRRFPTLFVRAGSATARSLRARADSVVAEHRAKPLVRTATGPAFHDVDNAALHGLIAAADSAHTHSLVLLRDGQLVGEWHSGGDARRIEAMSVTKSILNLAAGRLQTLGLLESLDTPVHHFFPQWSEGAASRVTICHLMTHTSGIVSDRDTREIYASDDFVQYALDSGVGKEPGSEFFYNNSAVNLLAGVISRIAGQPMDEFLREGLFAALGITDFEWSRDRAGNPHGMSGLQIHARDLAKLGQLVLNRGVWEDRRLIDAAWFDTSMTAGSPLNPRAGMLWWLIREKEDIVGYRADGYLGQYVVIYPESGLVAVRMVMSSPAYDPATDLFGDFAERVRALAR
ncbi:MAG TPA: serine hydrolase [Longimicrobiales bacterium]|nr:serine hydrolase [Longimicrobiales bacterium]